MINPGALSRAHIIGPRESECETAKRPRRLSYEMRETHLPPVKMYRKFHWNVLVRHQDPPGGFAVARVSIGAGSPSVVASAPRTMGGLDVIFGGVEVCEVRPRDAAAFWRKALTLAGLILLLVGCLVAWMQEMREDSGGGTLSARHCLILTGFATLYALCALRQMGVVWRFDHKRKTITRRHWLRGMSRTWKSGQAVGLSIKQGRSKLRGDIVQLGLVDAGGKMLAEVGRWRPTALDQSQVQSVITQINQVMWWK